MAGIIPAYAGSTRCLGTSSASFRDHPRIRGEHSLRRPTAFSRLGSSPHTRGAHNFIFQNVVGAGIIPAYAGSTMAWMHLKTLSRDHPRIRGEHCCDQWIITCSGGSSPHTRGALTHRRQDVALDGIIPAYAGSTPEKVVPAAASRDHPRIRGEHSIQESNPGFDPGSSPHTRGALQLGAPDAREPGIIPAYAGSTLKYLVII